MYFKFGGQILMALLKVKLRGKTVCEAGLSEERPYIAGRKEECDIVLESEKGISREHFQISLVEGQWTVSVLSRYGELFHNGETKNEFVLEHGDTFTLPPYEFEFYKDVRGMHPTANEQQYIHSESASGGFNQNLPMEVSHSPEVSGDGDFADKTVVGVAPLVAYLKIADAQNDVQEVLKLSAGESWVAGRDSSSTQIQIKDQRVSRKQFEIRRIGAQYQVMDLGSVNGTLLNGTPISSADFTNLKSGDVIAVLDNYFYFELHDASFQNKLDLIKVDQLAPISSAEDYALEQYSPAQQNVAPYQQPAYPQPYMSYPPQAGMPMGMPTQVPPVAKTGLLKNFDFEKNRKKLILGVFAFLLLAYALSSQDSGAPPKMTQAEVIAPGSAKDLFNKLKPEEQALVKQRYKDAKNFYMQGKYQLAQDEIVKIHDVVSEFEDTKEIERLAKEAIYIQEQQRRQEELERARVETEAKIQEQAQICKKKLNPQMTAEQLEDCLSPVLAFDPEHPVLQELRDQVSVFTAEREAAAAQRAEYRSRVDAMSRLYEKAKSVHQKGKPLDAISAYENVIKSKLPDPNGYKGQSQRSIASIRKQMNSKTAALQSQADQAYQSQNLKLAILSLRKARLIDPTNDELPDKIDRYTSELRKQMMVLYQEGILEESYGNVDGGESRKGAKDKWKKILELDIPDGEYYKKAFIKLKKYGG